MSSFIVKPEPLTIDPKTFSVKAGIKVGDIFYESWGYDQTQNDFAQVVSISPTGKSVTVRMMSAKRVSQGRIVGSKTWEVCREGLACDKHDQHSSNMVEPTVQHGQPFRLLVDRGYRGQPGIKGSYPFCWSDVENDPKTWSRRMGYFSLYEGPVYETPEGLGH